MSNGSMLMRDCPNCGAEFPFGVCLSGHDWVTGQECKGIPCGTPMVHSPGGALVCEKCDQRAECNQRVNAQGDLPAINDQHFKCAGHKFPWTPLV